MKSKHNLLGLILFLGFILMGCRPATLADITLALNAGIDTVEVNQTHEDAGAKAYVFGLVYPTTVIENTVDVSQVGSYHIVYQYTRDGLVKTIERVVFVVDETAPTLSLKSGIDTVIVGGEWIDGGVNTSDNLSDVTITVEESVDETIAGTYDVVYTATDESGNKTIMVRKVHIIAP